MLAMGFVRFSLPQHYSFYYYTYHQCWHAEQDYIAAYKRAPLKVGLQVQKIIENILRSQSLKLQKELLSHMMY